MSRSIERAELVKLLGATVGDVKATEAIESAAAKLGFAAPMLEDAQALAILDALGNEPGIVGIAARLVRVRLVLQK